MKIFIAFEQNLASLGIVATPKPLLFTIVTTVDTTID